jgi:transposase-like protein
MGGIDVMDKWINKKGWLNGYVDPIKQKEKVQVEPHLQWNVRVHVPLKCPGCRSRKVRCYGADKPILYYKCIDCSFKFKVIEKDDY